MVKPSALVKNLSKLLLYPQDTIMEYIYIIVQLMIMMMMYMSIRKNLALCQIYLIDQLVSFPIN